MRHAETIILQLNLLCSNFFYCDKLKNNTINQKARSESSLGSGTANNKS